MKKISTGIISEEELVKEFGTKKQLSTYTSNGRFVSSNKNTILKKARQYCDVTDLGDRRYKISNVKEIPMTKAYENIHTGIYKSLCPLLLERLASEKNPLIFTMGHWAREINMVNENYPLVKYNMDKAILNITPLQGIPKPLLIDFYNCCDSMIYSYMLQALKYLDDLGLIIWREVYMVTIKKIKSSKITNHQVVNEIEEDTHQATEEEMEYYAKCIGKADRKNNITENCKSERYYSEKSGRWARILQIELEKKHIDRVFKAYEIFATDYNRCKKVLNMYEIKDKSALTEQFNIDFIAKLNYNAENRYEKNQEHYDKMMFDVEDKYLDGYSNIAEFTVDEKIESCEYLLGEDK